MNIPWFMLSFILGLKDSLKGVFILFYVDKTLNERRLLVIAPNGQHISPERKRIRPKSSDLRDDEKSKVLKRTFQCCALNGGVFMLSVIFFYSFMMPTIRFFLLYLFGNQKIWLWIQTLLQIAFNTSWTLPLFILSKIINNLWFQDIADASYRYSVGRPNTLKNFSELIADTLFSIVVEFLFLVQCSIMALVPIYFLSEVSYTLHTSLLYSLYSFEYKWINMGWKFNQRLRFIETNWPYFVGFGLPLSILTRISSSITISACVFSILFPLFIISGNESTPLTYICKTQLKLFSPVVAISNIMFRKTVCASKNINEYVKLK